VAKYWLPKQLGMTPSSNGENMESLLDCGGCNFSYQFAQSYDKFLFWAKW
jgi:hypothetical protein